MITLEQYFGGKPHSEEHEANARLLLRTVDMLLEDLRLPYVTDPDTGTGISGARDGAGDGGFRIPSATTGSATSSHKQARGVDLYDPENVLDDAITDEVLTRHDLYREHPDATPTWCHLTTRAPGSGKRTFNP